MDLEEVEASKMLAVSNREFQPNLSRFFERIQLEYYPESHQPTLEFLKLLHKRFLCTFPFENLDLHFIGNEITDKNKCKVDIRPEAIEKKLLYNQRGGYCFELNHYLHYVLRALGYHVTPVMARVVWQLPPESAQSSRTHFLNIVTLPATVESPCLPQYLCDVAFGPASFVEPLSLEGHMIGQSQSTQYDTHRVIPYCFANGERDYILDNDRDHYLVQVKTEKNTWDSLYLFHKRELATYADWYGGNWQVATMPDSLFVMSILLSIVTDEAKITLFNDEYTFLRF